MKNNYKHIKSLLWALSITLISLFSSENVQAQCGPGQDLTNPTIICPGNITQNSDPGLCGASVTYATPIATDNCPGVTAWGMPFSGTVFFVGTTFVTWTATDAATPSANTAQCTFSVTVIDVNPPTFTNCPTDITVILDAGMCNKMVTWTPPTPADLCAGVTMSSNHNSGELFPVGSTTVTYDAMDLAGNHTFCSFNVIVLDQQNPVLSACPSNISLTTTGSCTQNTTWTAPTATDNCSAMITCSHNIGDAFPVGTTIVTYTAKDPSNNTSTCSFNVVVTDNQPPAFFGCPTDITLFTSPTSCSQIATWFTPMASDNCAYLITSTHNSGDFFNKGITMVTYTVTDASNNTSSCSFNVTVVDNISPSILCPLSIINVPNDNNVCGAIVTFIAPIGTDNCTGSTTALAAGFVSNATFPIGVTLQNYVVTDAVGLTNSCSFSVQVVDTQVPVITCPTSIITNNDAGVCGAVVTFVPPIGTDNCAGSITNLTSGLASGSVFPQGTTLQTYVVTDLAGNTNSCTFNVTVNDNENPVITQSEIGINVIIDGSGGWWQDEVSWTLKDASNNVILSGGPYGNSSTVVSAYVNSTNAPFTFDIEAQGTYNDNFCNWTIRYNGFVTSSGCISGTNNSNCTSHGTLSVPGINSINTPPAVGCPNNITLNTESGSCSQIATWITPAGTDNCSQTLTSNYNSGATFNKGITTVTYLSTDLTGNTNTCSFNVTVNDIELPSIFGMPADITVNTAVGLCNEVVTWGAPSAFDNCSQTLTSDYNSGATFNKGVTLITYTSTDASGNTSSSSFNVTVNDSEVPAITCPANIAQANDLTVCGAAITFTAPIGTDNCSSPVTTQTAGLVSGTVFPIGTTTQTYLVTDAVGNTNSCSFIVTINDTQAPAITCPANIIKNNDLDVCGAATTFTAPIGTDNCPSSITTQTAGLTSGTVYPIGTTNQTYLVTDASGNTNSCSFTVKINDTQVPAITCPANIIQSNDLATCGAVVTFVAPIGTDNCPSPVTAKTIGLNSGVSYPTGTTTQTYVVTDASGNTNTCTFTVKINDTQAPGITCPANIVKNNDIDACGAIAVFTAPIGADNCPSPVTAQTTGLTSGSLFPIGTTIQTYVVTDASGNTNSCNFSVLVNHTQAPAITCPANIIRTNDLNACNAVVTFAAPIGTDNCPSSITTKTTGLTSGSAFPIGTTTQTYLVTDVVGLTNSCSFTVTVNDSQLPVISGCPSNISLIAAAGTCAKVATWTAPTAADNCSVSTLTSNYTSGASFNVGTTAVNYIATDASGNTSLCTFNVTVVDNQVPTITCPTVPSEVLLAGFCSKSIVYAAPVTADNCGVLSVMQITGLSSGSFFNTGTTINTYKVTDLSGNTNECTFQVTLLDQTIPIIANCPANISLPAAAATCAKTATWTVPTATDNCLMGSFVSNYNSGASFPVGNTTVTYIATDASNNTAACSFNVNIYDNQLPVISGMPANISVSTAAGVCTQIVTWTMPTVADNCSASIASNISSGATFNKGVTTVTYTATDASNNTSSNSFYVTVNDIQAPAITCPVNVVMNNDLTVCGAVVTFVAPIGTDNCPSPVTIQTAGLASSAIFPIGTTNQTFKVTDAVGNTNSCSFTVKINDSQAPVIACPANIVMNNDLAACGATVTFIAPIGTDNCPSSVTTKTTGLLSGSIFPIGITTQTYVVTDASANTNTCSFTVKINDTQTPVIICPASIVRSNDLDACGAAVAFTAPIGTDNCPSPVTTKITGLTSGSLFPIGTTIQTYLVTDASGNTNSCNFSVVVNHTQAPAITCPSNIISSNDANNCSAVVTFTAPIGTDNCPSSITTKTTGLTSGSAFLIGTTTQTYLVTDVVGLTNSCSFTITVNDTQAPAITCPSNIVVSNDLSACGAVVTFVAPIGTDNCPSPVTIQTAGFASGVTYSIGTTSQTFKVTDASGNTNACSFTIRVNDTQVPVITCPANIVQNSDLNVCSAVVTFVAPIGTDNCPSPITVKTTGLISGSTFPSGTTTQTYVVTDASANTSTCSFTVKINDTQVPSIICPANIVKNNDLNACAAVVTFVAPIGTDNCLSPVTTKTTGLVSGSSFPKGITIQTYLVTDASANTNTCSFTITVNDTQAPAITCPGNIVQNNDLNACAAIVTFTAPIGTDNCLSPVTVKTTGLVSGSSFTKGITTQTYIVTDAVGLTNSCSFLITINDSQSPAITCPSNIIVNNDASVCGASVTFVAPIGTDNCPSSITTKTAGLVSGSIFSIGTTIQTYLVTDAVGNTNTCSFSVKVNDSQAPAIICPANIVQNNDLNACGAVVTFIAPIGTDNCLSPVTTKTAGLVSGSSFPIGITTQTYIVTDASSNTNTCSFFITVNDNTAPTITCPSNISVNNDPAVCGAVVTYAAITSDNCPGQTYSSIAGLTSGQTFNVGVTNNTLKVTDLSNNTATCSFTVTVIDNEKPTITCPNNITIGNDIGNCTAIVTFGNPIYADNCSTGITILQTTGLLSGSAFSVGTTGNTFKVTDAAGNTKQCIMMVTVTDIQKPLVSNCPTNITLNAASGTCSAIATWVPPTASDNCSAVTFTNSHNSGVSFVGGTTTVTYIASDNAGNKDTCKFTVTVVDQNPPTITCPANIATTTTLNLCSAVVTYGAPVIVDNCSTPVLTLMSGLVSGSAFPKGTTTNTYKATDVSGNTATCSFSVSVSDNEVPVISGMPLNISASTATGLCTQVVTWTAPTVSDNCSATITSNINSGTTFNKGTTTITYTATDAANNTTSSSFTVSVYDNEVPAITCPSNIVKNNDLNVCGAVVTFVAPIGTDNCMGAATILTSGLASGSTFPIGTTTQTYQVTDASGNTNSCSLTVNVNDIQLPVISGILNDISLSTSVGTCAQIATWIAPTASDNCSQTLTSNYTSGASFNKGTTTVTYNSIDASGNTASRSFTVTVGDIQAPVISGIPANISVATAAGLCTQVATWALPTASDNCTVASLVSNINSGATFNKGTTTVTYIATDASGNTANSSFTVSVSDNETPSITCGANIIANTSASLCGAVVTFAEPIGTDNCAGISTIKTAGLTSGSTFPKGITTETYTVTDAGGLSASCSFTVNVLDAISPVFSNCPSNVSINNGFGLCSAVYTWATPTATDVCDGAMVVNLTSSLSSGSNFPIGVSTVNYTATDLSGNASTCSFTITVVDNTKPSIACPSNIIVANDLGFCTAVVTFAPLTATDNCAGTTIAQIAGLTSGSIFPSGITTNKFVATDAAGNKDTCIFTVKVNETELPVINTVSNITVNTDAGQCGAIVTYALPVVSDNCGIPVLVRTTGLASGSQFLKGITTNTFIVTDASGNSATTSFTVTVSDNEAPAIACLSDISKVNDANTCGAIVTFVAPVGTDNCTGATTVKIDGLTSGSIFPVGITTQTYRVTDAVGNNSACSFFVTVADNENPMIVALPASVTKNVDLGQCSAIHTWIEPTTTDNCSSIISRTAGLASGSAFNLGVNTITYTAVDLSGHSTTQSFTVTVTDNVAPVIACNSNITVNTDLGQCSAVVTYATPVGTDFCPNVVTTQTAGLASGSIFPKGITTNTFTATDGNGNSTSCSFTVNVNDDVLPTITCSSNISVNTDLGQCSALVTYVAPIGTDICPNAITVQTSGLSTGTLFPKGITTNTFSVTDASGNTASCSFTVTVSDNEVPAISCLSNISTFNDANACDAVVTFTTPVGTDNCTGSNTAMTAGLISGSTFPHGTTTQTYVVTDASGNSATCSFNVTVIDNVLPVITCNSAITVNTDEGQCSAVVTYAAPIGTDVCPNAVTVQTEGLASGAIFSKGITSNTFMVTDASGNTSSCSFSVTVIDNVIPVIACSSDITVTTDAGQCNAVVTYTTPVGTDICANAVTIQTAGLASGEAFPKGITTNTFVVTDESGNTASCSFAVTVNDITLPVIACSSDITVSTDAGQCSAVVTYTTPVGTDICANATTVQTEGLASGAIFSKGITTNTFVVTDESGNTTSCSFTVTVNDNIAPVIACNSNITVNNNGTCFANVTFEMPLVSDNCEGATIVLTSAFGSGDNFAVGTTTITYLATDASGNTATCNFNVTVSPIDTTMLTAQNICDGTSYNFYGTDLTDAGTYYHTLPAMGGCDSVVALNLIVNPIFASTKNATICEGSTYVLGSQNLTTAGAFTETFTSLAGCDSVVTLTLSVNPIYTATKNATICDGSSYVFGNQTLTTAGAYTETFSTLAGCDSIVTLTLTVNPTFTATKNAEICNGSSYVFGTQTLTAAGAYTETFSTLAGCDSTVTLTLVVNNPSTATVNVSDCNPYTINGQTYTTTGVYTQTFVNAAGCDSVLTINYTNSSSDVTVTETACDIYTYNGVDYTTTGVYTQTPASCTGIVTLNVTINHSTTTTLTETACESYSLNGTTYSTSGVYTQHLTNAAGCDSTITLNLNINNSTTATQTVSACETYTWFGTTHVTSGTFTNVIPNAAGCDSTITLDLTINYATSAIVNQTACSSYTFNGTTYSATGIYTQTLVNAAGCDSTVTLDLVITQPTVASLNVADCNPYTINGETFTTTGVYTQTLVNAAGCDSILTINYTNSSSDVTITETACNIFTYNGVDYTTSGIYTQTAVGCTGIITLDLTINHSTFATLTETACNNFTLNGITYSASGVYTQSLINTTGCDSTITLNLTVNPVYTSTVNAAICNGNSYTLGTQTLMTAGTYTEAFSTLAGCDSTVTLTLVVNNPTAALVNVSDCNPYTINGQTYTTTGVYTQTFVNAVGCDSILTINYTNSSSDVTVTETACDIYTYNGVDYTTTGVYTQTPAGCTGIVTLNVTINHSTSATLTETACESYSLNGTTYSTTGVYTQHLTNAAGCDSTITLNLNINNSTTATQTVSACESYTWFGTTHVTSGTFTNVIPNAAGCDSTITLDLTINLATSSTMNQTACSSYTLNGTTYSATGIYTQTLINAAGCDSIVTLDLVINEPTVASINVADCNPFTINGETFSTTGVYTQTLVNVAGCDSILTINYTNSSSDVTITETACNIYTYNGVDYTTTGIYTQTPVGCTGVITLNVTINHSTTATVTASACNSYTLNGLTYNASGVFTQTLTNAAGCDSVLTLNLTINTGNVSDTSATACNGLTWNGVNFTQTGDYTHTFVNAAGCDSVVTLHLTINPGFSVNLGADDTLCFETNQTIVLDAGIAGAAYLWSDNSTAQQLTVSAVALGMGLHSIYVAVDNGTCIATDSIQFLVDVCNLVANVDNSEFVSLYPNPSNDVVNITFKDNSTSALNIRVLNSNGQILSNEKVDKFNGLFNSTLDVSKFNPGVYFVQFISNYKVVIRKITVQ